MSDVTATDFIQSSGAGSRVSGQVSVDCIVYMKETLKSKIHLHAPQTFFTRGSTQEAQNNVLSHSDLFYALSDPCCCCCCCHKQTNGLYCSSSCLLPLYKSSEEYWWGLAPKGTLTAHQVSDFWYLYSSLRFSVQPCQNIAPQHHK